MPWEIMLLSSVLLGVSRASSSVAVVGEDAYLNWTISNLSIAVNRAVRDPTDNLSLLFFFTNSISPNRLSPRVKYTGNLTRGILSFVLANVTQLDSGRYRFVQTGLLGGDVDLGGQELVVAETPNILGITSLSKLAVAGQEYKLNCSTESRSVPSYHNLTMNSEWKKNGVNIAVGADYSVNGTILTINTLNKKDNRDNVTCRTFEDKRRISTESNEFVINVLYGPDNVQVNPSGELTVNEGSSMNITCTGECSPPCETYQWQKDPWPNVIGSNHSYLMSAVRRNDSGVYMCTVINTNISKNATAQITIRVNYGPDTGNIDLSPNQIYYEQVESSSLSVNCSAACYPICQYRWTGPGIGNHGNTGVLSIPEIKRDQAGLFTCTVTNPSITSRSATATVSVTVFYGPYTGNITLSPNQISYAQVESSSLFVNCSAYCYPDCQYKWTGPELVNNGNTGALSIPEIKRDQAGLFMCTATNPKITSKTATATIYVTVYYPPAISIESRNGSFSETGLIINCTAHGIPERYTFSLIHSSLFSGIKIRQLADNQTVTTGVLVHWFSNPSFMDTGVYTCIVTNGIPDYRDGSLDKNMSTTVWIRDPPFVTSGDRDFYTEKGHSGRLVIEFYNSQLDANVTWNKQRNQTLEKIESSEKYNISLVSTTVTVKFYLVPIQQPGFIASLEIKNATEEDFISYQVHLQNSPVNISELTLNLRPRGHPDVPNDVHIIPNSITKSSVNIEWRSGFHGGSNQTFVIELKTQLNEGWTNYSHAVFGGMMHNKYYNVTVEDLHQNTLYFFQLYAWNAFGTSDYSTMINATTYAEIKQVIPNFKADETVIGGTVGAVVLLLIVFAVTGIILYRKRRILKSKSKDNRQEILESGRPESGLVENPVYDSSEPGCSSNFVASGVEYAVVSMHKKKAARREDPSTLYAQVDKYKTGKQGEAYENAELVGNNPNPKDPYENSRSIIKTQTNTEHVHSDQGSTADNGLLVSKDALNYAELMLGPAPTINGRPLIRGINDRTEYAEISYGKRGKLLPDSGEVEGNQ